jgi:hypothetical protein
MKGIRGQAFSLDLVFSMLGFMVILILVIASWSFYSNRLDDNVGEEELQLRAFLITDVLVQSPGFPRDWEKNISAVSKQTVTLLGLAKKDRVLSDEKINLLAAIDYNNTKEIFNIKQLEFHLQILDLNDNEIEAIGKKANESKYTVAVARYVLQNNQRRKVLFTLWRPHEP